MIFGHEQQRGVLRELIYKQALSPAHIFAGPEGIGKKLIALELASNLLCQSQDSTCGTCHNCKLIQKNNHPDVITVEARDKQEWNIEGVRSLLATLGMKSFQGGSRIIIFNNAEELSIQATNSLLKSIEEPRPGTYFILVTENSNSLLPTVVSRCQQWFFKPLRPVDISKIIKNQEDSDLKQALAGIPIDEISILSNGSMAMVTKIAESYELWEKLNETLDEIVGGNKFKAITLAEEIKDDKDNIRTYMNFLRIYGYKTLKDSNTKRSCYNWSTWLTKLIKTEQYILKRNLNPAYQLQELLLSLSSSFKTSHAN